MAGGWLIRYVATGFAALHMLSWLALWVGDGGMVVASLWEMWGNPAGLPPMSLPGQS